MLLAFLVALLSAAAVLLMAMPFVLVRHARQHQDASAPQLLSDAPSAAAVSTAVSSATALTTGEA